MKDVRNVEMDNIGKWLNYYLSRPKVLYKFLD